MVNDVAKITSVMMMPLSKPEAEPFGM